MELEESKEFEIVLDQLMKLERPENLNTVGLFEYVNYVDRRSRERIRHEFTIIKIIKKNETSRKYHSWFLNISAKQVELLEHFSLGPLAGHKSITKYKRVEGKLLKGKSKLISIS